ncbi:MAG: DUF1009 domain-containing protein [Hyphomicrobiales bacterium]|nr:MAG: DUF1009 domain-containing protein [Hyphomicrobiales bacterium]
MARRLTLVAGAGDLVPHLAAAIARSGDPVQILDLAGRAPTLGPHAIPVSLDDPAGLVRAVTSFRTSHIVLAGGVHLSDTHREGLAAALGLPDKIAGSLGDIGLATMVMAFAARHRVRLVGAHHVAPELVAPEGHIAGPVVDASAFAAGALKAARAVGTLDLGQAIVMAGKRAIAAEDAGGTDALLARVAVLREEGRTGNGQYPLILAKARKPKQPDYVDLPAIGPETVINAAAAGISIIVVEARTTLVIERARLEAEAAVRGISVIGLRHG